MKNIDPILEFNPSLKKLSKNEKTVLGILTEAARLIGPLYKMQENQNFPGANFYPQDVTKEEIMKAASKNPEILSPYTVVEKIGGEFITIPYHKKYATLLKPIADKLVNAAKITENKQFAKALIIQSQALLDGSYEKAEAAWLRLKPYRINISIGPNDYFDDRLMFIKYSYQAWVGVVDAEGTERLNDYKETILNVRRKGLVPTEVVSSYDRVNAKVLDVILFSGLLAKTEFPGVNYPVDMNLVEKYGSEITLFKQPNDVMIQNEIIPTLKKMFPKEIGAGYSLEDLSRANLRYTATHEFAHSYLYYKNASANLKDLFRSIYELAATILGFRLAGYLLLKDRINNKQFESMIMVFLCKSLYLITSKQSNKLLLEYKIGSEVFINFLKSNGAIKDSNGKIIPNFIKIYLALQNLSHILEHLLSSGSHNDAAKFIKQYSN